MSSISELYPETRPGVRKWRAHVCRHQAMGYPSDRHCVVVSHVSNQCCETLTALIFFCGIQRDKIWIHAKVMQTSFHKTKMHFGQSKRSRGWAGWPRVSFFAQITRPVSGTGLKGKEVLGRDGACPPACHHMHHTATIAAPPSR